MIERIISECEQALSHNLYFAALSLALILPDMCAKAKYPNEKGNKKRYTDWFNEYVAPKHKHPNINEVTELPYASGEIVYELRCQVLHQGTLGIDREKFGIYRFQLVWEHEKPQYHWSSSGSFLGEKHLDIPIRTLCATVLDATKEYYRENKDQFNFINYSVVER